MPKRNFNEEHSFPRIVKPSLIEMEMETRRLTQEVIINQFLEPPNHLIWGSRCHSMLNNEI